MPLPPPDSPFGKPISNELNKEIMDAFMRLPNPLEAQIEGHEGPIDLPPEQQAEAFRNVFFILMRHMQNMAAKLDVLYAAVEQLEKKVYGAQRET